MEITANHAAFATVTLSAGATIGCVALAAALASKVALVIFTILAAGSLAVSMASITAWFDSSSNDVESYFSNMKSHAGFVVAGLMEYMALRGFQMLFETMLEIGSRAFFSAFGYQKYESTHNIRYI